MKIYTRTGDTGETSLFGGTRVSKGDARVDAYGEVDELNAWLGFAHASLSASSDSARFADIGEALIQIQRDLFALGARLAASRRRRFMMPTSSAWSSSSIGWRPIFRRSRILFWQAAARPARVCTWRGPCAAGRNVVW